MPNIIAKAYCNNEVGYIAWSVDQPITGAYGFQVTRIFQDDGPDHKKGDRRILPAWVPFKGQRNPNWIEQDTSVWPVQGLFWRDLTLRKSRDSLRVRASGFTVKYEVRAVGPRSSGRPAVPLVLEKTYEGDAVPLSYYSDPALSNAVTVTDSFGDIRAAFTNGILSSQWLTHQIDAAITSGETDGVTDKQMALRAMIRAEGNKIRDYLTGDVLGFLRTPLDMATKNGGKVLLALYELEDLELVELLIKNKKHIRIILANSSKARNEPLWDVVNKSARDRLVEAGVDIQHRMFNNSHIGHNKFAVYIDRNDEPQLVMTGSTNWTATGLCGQSNNALLITDRKVAEAYRDTWLAMHDKDPLVVPPKFSDGTGNKQGAEFRTLNMKPASLELDKKKTSITIWQSPNTKNTTKPGKSRLPEEGAIPPELIPPDLTDCFQLIDSAKEAVFFLVFMPSVLGRGSIVERAIEAGMKDSNLLVIGAVSDPKVLPNHITTKKDDEGDDEDAPKVAQPHVFENPEGNISVVQADALYKGDIVGDFEAEIKTLGNAIIHDKIVVIDPLSDNCCVITGSHNLGLKASYENDENLLIIKGNRRLAEAYAVHAMDVYDHYKWRARKAEDMGKAGAAKSAKSKKMTSDTQGEGRLELGGSWFSNSKKGRQGRQAKYFSEG